MLKESYRNSRTIGYYVSYQSNDKDKDNSHRDCTIRAFCKVFNKKWMEIFEDLYLLAKKNQNILNISDVYDLYSYSSISLLK